MLTRWSAVRSRLPSRLRYSSQTATTVLALAAAAVSAAALRAAAGSWPWASSCSASAAPLRAAASVSAGQPPSVNLVGRPAYLYLTAQDLAPDGCSTSQRPEPPSLISRRCGPGLSFSMVFAVSFRVTRYPVGWRVTKSPVLPCYPVLHHTAEQSIFVKQIRGRSAPVCSALLPVRHDGDARAGRCRLA